MSEENTQNLPDTRSFEERVFARFDALDARLTTLEEKVDSRLRETRPIWEGVLARLTTIESRLGGVESELARMNRQFRSFVADIFQLRVRVEKLEEDNDTQTA